MENHGKPTTKPTTTERRNETACKTEPSRTKHTTFWVAVTDHESRTNKADGTSPISQVKSLGLKVFQPTIRSTAMTQFETCKRKYMYRYRLGLRPRSYMSALHIGDIYHQIMCELYCGQPLEQALGIVSKTTLDQQVKLEMMANDVGMLQNGKTLEAALHQLQSDTQLAVAMARWVWKNYPINFDIWENVLPPETLIECKYDTIYQPIRVRIDGLLKKRDSDEVWIVDHKTTALMSPTIRAKSALMEVQPKLYRIVVESYLEKFNKEHGTKLTCVGIVHNFIRKPGIRFSPDRNDKLRTQFTAGTQTCLAKVKAGGCFTDKQRETHDSEVCAIKADSKFTSPWEKYLARVTKWYEDEARMKPEDPPYLRSRIRFIEPIMTTELLTQLRQADRASRSDPDFSKFYRDPAGTACYNYNTQCPYWDLCTTPVSNWTRIIASGFDVVTRDEEDEGKHE